MTDDTPVKSVASTQLSIQLSELINGADSYSIMNMQVAINMDADFSNASNESVQYATYIPFTETDS